MKQLTNLEKQNPNIDDCDGGSGRSLSPSLFFLRFLPSKNEATNRTTACTMANTLTAFSFFCCCIADEGLELFDV